MTTEYLHSSASFFVLLTVISVWSSSAYSQWISCLGGSDGQVESLLPVPRENGGWYIFAGTANGGVFRSTDSGLSWTAVNNGLLTELPSGYSTIYRNLTAVRDRNGKVDLFVGSSKGLLRSTNDGDSWLPTNLRDTNIVSLAGRDSILFAGSNSNGIFLSKDFGESWMAVNAGLTNLNVSSVAQSSNGKGPAFVFAGTYGGGIFRSSDDGSSWVAVNNGLKFDPSGNYYLVDELVAISNGVGKSILVAGVNGNGVVRSNDNGDTWVTVLNEFPLSLAITDDGAGHTSVYAGTLHGLFISRDSGATWSKTGFEYFVRSIARVYVNSDTTLLFAGTRGYGMFRSEDSGASWINMSAGLMKSHTLALSAYRNPAGLATILAGTLQGGVLRSTDNGFTWTSINKGLLDYDIRGLGVNQDENGRVTFFAGTQNSGVFRSTDAGNSWVEVNEGMTGNDVRSFAVMYDSAGQRPLLAGAYGKGVFSSINNGDSWTLLNNGLTNVFVTGFTLPQSKPDSPSLFVATFGGGVFHSTDYGRSWKVIDEGLDDLYVTSIASTIDQSGGTFILAGTENKGVFRSTNNGTGWTAVNSGLPTVVITALTCVGTNVFAGTWRAGTFLSTNAGQTWANVSQGCPDATVISFVESEGQLFAGALGGDIWRRPLSQMVTAAVEDQHNLPTVFTLKQNYPNPFNPSTIVNFQLPIASRVKLSVFDLLGREVARLVDETRMAGNHKVTWDASGFPSGIYFARLEAGGHMITRKMCLIK